MQWPAGWKDPARLEILRDTGLNCLVQESPASPEFAAAAARMGLDLLPATKVEWKPIAEILHGQGQAVTAIANCAWPGVQRTEGGAGSGPTGSPWVDSNGWQIRLARSRVPHKSVWVSYDPSDQPDYLLAIVDPACFGARWAVQLDKEIQAGLEAGNTRAADTWKRMTQAIGFFERHRAWQSQSPAAKLAVISDFAGPNEVLGSEVLNLAARRHLAYRIIERDEAGAAKLDGLEGVLYIDEQAPDATLLAKLVAFARNGGLLMVPRATAALIEGLGAPVETQPRSAVSRFGKGRVAQPLNEWDDPYLLAADAHLLLSYRNDPVRLFNAGLLMPYVTEDGNRRTVQVVNYAGRGSANFVSLGLPASCHAARLWTLEAGDAQALEISREAGRPELHLPSFRTYAAVELES